LCRTRIGLFHLKDALTPEEFEKELHQLKQTSEGQSDT